MKLNYLTLEQWQELLDAFKAAKPNAKSGAAFRIDNTIFSTARYYGAFTYNDAKYCVFYFNDGALLGVRMDFLKWAEKHLRENADKYGEKPMEKTFWDKQEEETK